MDIDRRGHGSECLVDAFGDEHPAHTGSSVTHHARALRPHDSRLIAAAVGKNQERGSFAPYRSRPPAPRPGMPGLGPGPISGFRPSRAGAYSNPSAAGAINYQV